ncbi:hypothetical protein PV328_005708 [Microctonus aethiopoides]|uniref:Uncharacterized protein n=1 Tax=Microctonus aethiopoides TaxID=144406 RepID=A0AA39FNA4_9HYME|nr:hypothetical protein PV328_005708 [Microctonus aethiopoides]
MVCRTVSIILLIIHLTGQIICFLLNFHDKKAVIEIIMIFLSGLYCLVKYLNNIIHLRTMTKLLESMKENQAVFMKGKEKQILDKHAHNGKLFVHGYSCKFASLLEIMYVWCFGVVIVLCVPAISYSALQLITHSNTTQEVIQLIMFIVIQLLDLFFNCYLSQKLIDESESIQKYINFSDWYKVPINTQKLLILTTLRSQKPSGITAGKMMTLGMENFGAMVKTAVSYLTVLMAVQ